MKRFLFSSTFILSVFIALQSSAQTDLNLPAACPEVKIVQDFSTSSINIDYSRPSIKGRSIFGDLVPYNQLWRTGANQCTKVTFNEDVDFGGIPIPAGTYALYSIPGREHWQVILNNGITNWGVTGFSDSETIAKVNVPIERLLTPVQTLDIQVTDITDSTCSLAISWDKVRVSVPIIAHNDSLITSYLENALTGENPPYTQAANYYLSKDKKLDDALVYASKAVDQQPKEFYLRWLKAQILYKLDKKSQAVKEAKIAADLAKGSTYENEYKRDYDLMKTGRTK